MEGTQASYDAAENLKRMVSELDPKQLRKAVRNALKTEATRVKRAAVANLKGTGITHASAIGKTIRAKSYRDGSGFLVAADFIGGRYKEGKGYTKGFYKNSKGKEKPVAFWWSVGTDKEGPRQTRKGKNRGSTEAHSFMDDAKRSQFPGVTKRLGEAYENAVAKIVAKLNKR